MSRDIVVYTVWSKLIVRYFKGRKYTGVVNPKPTIGKPCNGQRNVDNCMRGTKTENKKNIK